MVAGGRDGREPSVLADRGTDDQLAAEYRLPDSDPGAGFHGRAAGWHRGNRIGAGAGGASTVEYSGGTRYVRGAVVRHGSAECVAVFCGRIDLRSPVADHNGRIETGPHLCKLNQNLKSKRRRKPVGLSGLKISSR